MIKVRLMAQWSRVLMRLVRLVDCQGRSGGLVAWCLDAPGAPGVLSRFTWWSGGLVSCCTWYAWYAGWPILRPWQTVVLPLLRAVGIPIGEPKQFASTHRCTRRLEHLGLLLPHGYTPYHHYKDFYAVTSTKHKQCDSFSLALPQVFCRATR